MQKLELQTANFIKGYEVLRQLPLTLTQINLLEYVLSYQANGQQFFGSSANIGKYLKLTEATTKNMVSKLAIAGYLITNTFSNNGSGYGGKTRYMTVNIDFINELLSEVVTPLINEGYNEDDDPRGDNQDTEYTRFFAAHTAKPQQLTITPTPAYIKPSNEHEIFGVEDDVNRVETTFNPTVANKPDVFCAATTLKVVAIEDDLTSMIKAKYPAIDLEAAPMPEHLDYLQGMFENVIVSRKSYLQKYKAIQSNRLAA